MRSALLAFLLAATTAFAGDGPHRIVSLSPNMTEILYGVGAFDRVVGISDYCTFPPEVKSLPSVGGWHNPSLEKLMALHPDQVIADSAQAPFVVDKFRALGLNVVTVPNHTVDDVYEAITTLGHLTNHDAQAATLVATTRARLQLVAKQTASLPKIRVVLIVNRTPGTLGDLYTATEGGYLAELVKIAGGVLPVPPAKNGYGRLSKEDLLAINPDVILDFIHGVKSRFAGDPIEAWRDMPELKAVKDHRVFGVYEDYVPHASQRIVETAELFARLMHTGRR